MTNIGPEPIQLPSSIDQNIISHTQVLTFYFTSDAIVDTYFSNGERFAITPTSAELYGQNGDPQTFYLLAPNKAIRVHASTRCQLKAGPHSLTAHAELLEQSAGKSEVLGTVESIAVEKVFSSAVPAAH